MADSQAQPQSFAVGSAPWESQGASQVAAAPAAQPSGDGGGGSPQSFAVGEAPWEKAQEPSTWEKIKASGKRLLHETAEQLPVAGAILGGGAAGLAGAAGGTLALPGIGTAAGAAELGTLGAGAGAMAGTALKQIIEQKFGLQEYANETAKGMAAEALGGPAARLAKAAAPAVGEALTAVPAPVIKAYLDGQMPIQQLLQASGGKIAVAAEAVSGKISQAISSAKADLEDPVLQLIGKRATTQSDAEVGQTVKNLVVNDIQAKHGPFTEAYGKIDAVSQGLPLSDEGRRSVTESIKDWALENHPESSDTYKILQKHANNINASNTGAQLRGAQSDIAAELSDAYRSGNSKRIEALTELQSRVSDFQEKELRGLAQRVANGSASPEELASFQKLNANGPGQNTGLTPKDIAQSYLDNVDRVNKEYGGFKDYLAALQSQTGAKKSMGAGTLIKNIQAIPDEKLVQKMFTTNNAAALSRLKEEQPQVFSELAGSHIRDLVKDASGKEGLDVNKFISSVNEMPKEIRNLTFSPEELKSLQSVADNPKLKRINELNRSFSPEDIMSAGRGGDTKAAAHLVELSQLTGQNLMTDASRLAAAKEIGKASAKDMITKAAHGAIGGGVTGEALHGAGLLGPKGGVVAGAVGALGNALRSPFALKQGLDAISSPAAPQILGRGMIHGTQGVANMLGANLQPPEGP